ncbi:MAG: hypothetical protein COT84_00790 [Chlamydiae bacterium CG10_big_fil_rev_8_21_14_0_10_35_9]|nr:MAG: hypothetical protein COT84_00790 [Chlamydiae bacterium CG10_big_fil_rev_8_21_14_0_10_35_9]
MKRKFISTVFIAVTCMASMAFAGADNDVLASCDCPPNRCDCPPPPKKECCPCPPKCVKSPSKCSCCDYMTCCPLLPLPVKCGNVFVEGEYLYWKAYTEVPYAIARRTVPPYTAGTQLVVDEDVKSVNMNASSGYRLGMGAYLSDCSLLYGTYRQFATDGTDGISASATTSMPLSEQQWLIFVWNSNIPTSIFSTPGPPNTANARQRHREKVLDFDFLREFACGRFSINPFVGVRFAWVKSDLSIDYFRGRDPNSSIPIDGYLNHTDVNNHMNFGVGLHTGLQSNVDLGWGFGLFGTSSVSALVGQFQFEHREDVTDLVFVAPFPPIPYTTTRSFKVTDFQTAWELGVGLDWGHHFCDCAYYLGFKVGYEANIWPNFFRSFHTLRPNGSVLDGVIQGGDRMSLWSRSLLTHGLNVGARFDF